MNSLNSTLPLLRSSMILTRLDTQPITSRQWAGALIQVGECSDGTNSPIPKFRVMDHLMTDDDRRWPTMTNVHSGLWSRVHTAKAFTVNKAGYTATLVACGWAGAVFELLKHLGKCSEAKDRKNIKKVKWGPTDRPTNQPTDGQSGV